MAGCVEARLGSIPMMDNARIFLRLRAMACGLLLILLAMAPAGCDRSVKQADREDWTDKFMQDARKAEEAGKVDTAIELFTEALDRDPKLARAHLELALLVHAYKKEYVLAVYHYRRYLTLRPDTDKRELIEGRIRMAERALAAALAGAGGSIAQTLTTLEKENADLKARVRQLQTELRKQSPGSALLAYTPTAGGTTPTTVPSNTARARTYTVKRGDNLSKIAEEVYGDKNKWQKIYDANRVALGGSEKVRVGLVLTIPPP